VLRCGLVMTAAQSVMEPLPTLPEQAERLLELGVHRLAGWSEKRLRGVAEAAAGPGSLLAIHPDLVAAAALVPVLNLSGKQGFLVVDMPDVDEFAPTVELPDSPVYLVDGIDRGDAMANWSPDEADPAIAAASRTPLTLTEGLHWLLQRPETLQQPVQAQAERRAGRQDPGDLDQQRHRARRRGQPERAEGRLVLGGQSAHLAGLRVSRGSQDARRGGLTRRTAAPRPASRWVRPQRPRDRCSARRTSSRESRSAPPRPI